MKDKKFNINIENVDSLSQILLRENDIEISKGNALTVLKINKKIDASYKYLKIDDKIYDVIDDGENGFITIKNENIKTDSIFTLYYA